MVSLAAALKSSFYVTLARGYYLALRIVFVLLLVAVIGPEAYGRYSYAQSWYVFLIPLALWGGNELVISRYLKTDAALRNDFAGSILSVRLLLGCIGVAVIAGFAIATEPDAALRQLMLVYSTGLLIRSVIAWLSAMFLAVGKGSRFFWVSVAFLTVEVVLVLGLAVSERSLLVIASAQVGVWLATMVVMAAVHLARSISVLPRWDSDYVRQFLKDGLEVGLANFCMYGVSPCLLLLFRHGGSSTDLGSVALATTGFMILLQISVRVSNALLPAFGTEVHEPANKPWGFLRASLIYSVGLIGMLSTSASFFLSPLLADSGLGRLEDPLTLVLRYLWLTAPILLFACLRMYLINERYYRTLLVSTCGGLLTAIAWFSAHKGSDVATPLVAMAAGFITMTLFALLRQRELLRGSPSPMQPIGVVFVTSAFVVVVSEGAGASLVLLGFYWTAAAVYATRELRGLRARLLQST
ncbi:MAG: hypothetical protein AAF671_02355 [Pseudomonadota bacterium]